MRFAVLSVVATNLALAYEFDHDKIVTEKFMSFASHLSDVTHFEQDLGVPAQHSPLDDGKLPFSHLL